MPDGTVDTGGDSSISGGRLFTMPTDAPSLMTFSEATDYAAKLDALGYRDWRLPDKVELNILFRNRTAIGGFTVTDAAPENWYWSSSHEGKLTAWSQRFSDGCQSNFLKGYRSSVRLVRSDMKMDTAAAVEK